MGNATSTATSSPSPMSVQAFANACELAPWVASVQGVSGESMSLSDQWLVTLKPNLIMYDGVPLHQVFLKVVPERVSHIDPVITTALDMLHREIFIYANIIKPIIDQHICPFFLPVLNVSYNCPAAALVAMLGAGGPGLDPQQVFLRNMTIILHGNDNQEGQCFFADRETAPRKQLKRFKTGEPTVQVENPENKQCMAEHATSILVNQQYTLLVTKAITSNLTSDTYIPQLWAAPGQQNKLHLFYFQVAIGFLVLLVKKVHHNDLHFQNVMLEQLPTTATFVYGVGKTVYHYETNTMPLIFDFDRSRTPQLGDDMGDDMQMATDLFSDMWCYFFGAYAQTRDPVIPQCVFREEDLAAGTALWDQTIASNPKPSMIEYIEVGKTILDGLQFIQDDIVNIVFDFAGASGVVAAYPLDDPELFKLRTPGTHVYYIPPEMLENSSRTSSPTLVAPDVVVPLALALHSDEVQDTVENKDEIIAKKQQLAKNKLKLLHLKLQLEKK